MRKCRGWRKVVVVTSPWAWWISLCGIILANSLSVYEPVGDGWQKYLKPTTDWFKNHKIWLSPGFALAYAIAGVMVKMRETNHLDKLVKKLLNNFRRTAFPQGRTQNHRVTLFKHHMFYLGPWGIVLWKCLLNWEKPPWGGWLVAYERAGEYHLKTNAHFYAPKHDPDKAKGFAGIVFKARISEQVENLQKISMDSPKRKLETYAQNVNLTVEELKERLRLRPEMPQSYWGTVIEADNKMWGVLVVDCLPPQLPQFLEESFAPVATCMSQIFSRKSE